MGLGVVGRKTLTMGSFITLATGPLVSVATKAMAQRPFLGYSTSTTSLNEVEFCAAIVSKTCLVVP